ncbi:MAG: helix-turn-helix transcriptional regulator [Clostridia bacterium]|nr:helix-turn-helix transcriptional regulator [Clostridia bacterium]
MKFGENLKCAREAKGLTQQALAQQLYVTRQTVSRWETGTRYPDLYMAKRMAELLDTTVDALLGEDTMRLYAEQQPVLESHRARTVQVCLYGMLLSMCLLQLLTTMLTVAEGGFMLKEKLTSVAVWEYVLFVSLSVVGVVQAMRQNLSPRWVGLIGAGFFLMEAVGRLFDTRAFSSVLDSLFFNKYVFVALDLLFAVLVFCFFDLRLQKLFVAVCGVGAVTFVWTAAGFGRMLHLYYRSYAVLGVERGMLWLMTCIRSLLLIGSVCGMLLFQAVALRRKRKRLSDATAQTIPPAG